jgi:hypothetical protein
MFFHDLLKQLVLAGVALAASTYLWRTVTNEYTAKVAESIKNQKPMEFKPVEFKPAFKFDSNPTFWQPPTINMSEFQLKSTSGGRPAGRKRPG